MNPTQSPYQFVKSTVNGETVYDALPPGQLFGGQQTISFDEYKSGVLGSNRYKLAQQTGDYLGPLGLSKEKFDSLIGGNMASGYASSPTNPGNFAPVSAINQDATNQAAVAAGTMKEVKNAQGQVVGLVPTSSSGMLNANGTVNQQAVNQAGAPASPDFQIPKTVAGDILTSPITKTGVLEKAKTKAPNVNLQPGMQGEDVKQLQSFLIEQGYDIPAGATGYFGDQTKAALTKFQKEQGVKAGSNFGYYGPLTQDVVSKINADISTATAGAKDTTSAISGGNASLKDAGLPTLKFSGEIDKLDPTDVNSIFSFYLNSMADRQKKLGEAQDELNKAMNLAQQAQVGIEGQSIPMTAIGRQLQNLKENVAYRVTPLQNQVESLTKQLGFDQNQFQTMLAYGKYLQDSSKPMEIKSGDTTRLIYPDGRVQVYTDTSGGGGFTFPTGAGQTTGTGLDNVPPEYRSGINDLGDGRLYFDLSKFRDTEKPSVRTISSASGIPILSREDVNKVQDAVATTNAAKGLVTNVFDYATKAFSVSSKDKTKTQLATDLGLQWAKYQSLGRTSLDPNMKLYRDTVDSMLAKLSRAAGEVGVLTNQDIDRIKAGLPSAGDTTEIIMEKQKNFQNLFETTVNSAIDAYYNTISGTTKQSSGSSNTQPQSNNTNNPLDV